MVSPPSKPILGMYLTGGAFPTPGASAWASGPTTNLAATYLAWGQSWSTYAAPFVTKCNSNGLIPFVELEPWEAGSSFNVTPLFTDITGGTYDTWLTGIGTAIAATGKPVILTFAHEMNVSGQYPWSHGDTGSGPSGGTLTPAEWILGWNYVRNKVNSTAGGYALWMWACSAWTGGTTVDPSPWWPGSSNLDMVGIDGYPNTQYGSSLGTFAGQIQPTVTAIRTLGWTGDIYIAETNLAQMVSSGGESITNFVSDMHSAGISGVLEFEDAAWGLPQMSSAQWTEYNNAIAAYYGAPTITGTKIGTLTDAFSGSVLSASKWYLEPDPGTGSPSGTYTVSGGKLNLAGGTYADLNYHTTVNSQSAYDLTGSAAFCQVIPNTSSADYNTAFSVRDSGFGSGYTVGVTGGKFYVESWNAYTPTTLFSVTYNATSHAWMRIRESSGKIYFETSPDSQTWTTQYSTTTETVGAWTAATSYVQFVYGSTAGTASPLGAGSFANFNTAVSGGTTGTTSGTFSAVGSFIQTTALSFSWTPAAVGNVLVVIAFSVTSGSPVTGLSSSNASWTQVVSDQTLGSATITEATAFIGTATLPSIATVTLTTAATSGNVRVLAREFNPGGEQVALDTFVTMNGDVAGAVKAWPSITPTKGGGELLFGYERNLSGTAVAGTDSGVTYFVDTNSNGGAYNLSVSGTTAVGFGDTDSRTALVLLLYGTTATSGGGGTTVSTGNSLWYDNGVQAAVNAKTALLNGGTLRIYSGAQPPLNGGLSGTLLVSMAFGSTAFASAVASGGTVTALANTITAGVASATGTAGYFALVTASGQTVLTGTVGTSAADLNLPSLSITSGTQVGVSSFAISESETGS